MHPFLTISISPVLCLLCGGALLISEELHAPRNVSATFTEKIIDIRWDPVGTADGYNIYSAPAGGMEKAKRTKVNPVLVVSGPRFAYIWDIENGEKVRRVKGHVHYLSATAVESTKTGVRESGFSEEIDNCYFSGYGPAVTRPGIRSVLVDSQASTKLPVGVPPVSVEKFIAFMQTAGAQAAALIADSIDPLQTGACAPIATIIANLLTQAGISALKIEGRFIKEYHNFVIVNIAGNEYVIDFATDQFVPGFSPVCIPRDYCNINAQGKLSLSGTPIYKAAKIYTANQTSLVDDSTAEIYNTILRRAGASISDKQ
ncbi:MAG: hypothetical protein GF350_16275 [Chitinivibrionales bacterium]|nr:hypothetical protein [Chitinivibrionales bacterium]